MTSTRARALGKYLWMTTAPLAQTVVGIPLATATFTTGWILQFAGRPRQPVVDASRVAELDEATAELLG